MIPPIDVHVTFEMTEPDGTVRFTGWADGDGFPNVKVFVRDPVRGHTETLIEIDTRGSRALVPLAGLWATAGGTWEVLDIDNMNDPAHLSIRQRIALALTLVPLLLPTLLGAVWPNVFTLTLPLTIAAMVLVIRGSCNRRTSIAQWLVIIAALIVVVPAIVWVSVLLATGDRLF